MATISQRNTGSVWDKRARYIEQSTSALQRYVEMGDAMARFTKMKEYTAQQAREADISLYSRLLSDEQKTGPGKMPERSSGVAHTSETTGWGRKHLAVSGVSHQPYVQTAHHSSAFGTGGYDIQINGSEFGIPSISSSLLSQQDSGASISFVGFNVPHATDPYNSPSPLRKSGGKGYTDQPPGTPISFKTRSAPTKKTISGRVTKSATNPYH